MSETSHFQFYGTFETIISYLPEDEQLKFYKAFVRYGLYGEEPNFDGKDMAIFCQVKFAIDNQRTKNCALAENGRKGGKAKQNEASESKAKQNEASESKAKQNEASESKAKQNEASESKAKQNEASESKIDEMKRNEMNGNETKRNEHEFETSQESESERESNACAPPDSSSKDYARQVFDTCARIGMPNCNNNFVNFLQRDFKLALCGIRELKLHSEEVLGALENYGEVLKLKREGRTWWERDLRLDQLCSGRKKLILNFLPDNFKIADYAKEKPDKGGGLPEDRIRI